MSAPADPLAELPAAARRSLDAIAAKLPPDWTLADPRRTSTGWVVSIYAADGTHGGEIGIMDVPPDDGHHRPPGENDPI
jgi:hypothetical protein